MTSDTQKERVQAGAVSIVREGVPRVVKLPDGYHVDSRFQRLSSREKMLEYLKRGSLDLHLHTNASDGFDSPPILLKKVMEAGLKTFSITDHDTLWGVEDCVIIMDKLRQMRIPLPDLVPGVELSLDFEGQEIHLLAYFPSGGENLIKPFLLESKRLRDERNRLLCERLGELGMPIKLEELNRQGGQVINRVHAALLMLRKGYVSSAKQAFDRWLGEGKPAYIPYEHPEAAAAIQLVKESGGLTVLAHPYIYDWHQPDPSGLCAKLERLRALGMDGVEVVHGDTPRENWPLVAECARELDLLRTIGSDDHGLNKKGVRLFKAGEDYTDLLLR